MTALHWAVHHGHLDTVRALIHAGASLNIQDGRRWALKIAAVDATDWCGRRGPEPPPVLPLHAGARAGHARTSIQSAMDATTPHPAAGPPGARMAPRAMVSCLRLTS